METIKKGTLVKVISDNENYEDFNSSLLEITNIAYNTSEHPGYDDSVAPDALCDFVEYGTGREINCSLYEYEFEVIKY
jgi:hypothetical protein